MTPRPARSAALGATTALALAGVLVGAAPTFAAPPLSDSTLTGADGSSLGATASQTKCDVNGDGRDDLAVGAASWTAPGSTGRHSGAVWVLTDLSADVTVGADPVPGFRIDGPARGYDLMGLQR